MFLLFFITGFVAANPVAVQNQNANGVIIQVPDCFPFCEVEADTEKLEALKVIFKPCFPFCDVPVVEGLNNSLTVEALPACFPLCGNSAPATPGTPATPETPSTPETPALSITPTPFLFEECFPFCNVSFPDFEALFPSCFPFCNVDVVQVPNNTDEKTPGVTIKFPDCFPFCGVEAEKEKLEELQVIFEPCFPFCDVPVKEGLNNSLAVEALPACFPLCGISTPATPVSPITPTPTLFEECFPFCNVPFPYFEALFPSCFPFCGVVQIGNVNSQN